MNVQQKNACWTEQNYKTWSEIPRFISPTPWCYRQAAYRPGNKGPWGSFSDPDSFDHIRTPISCNSEMQASRLNWHTAGFASLSGISCTPKPRWGCTTPRTQCIPNKHLSNCFLKSMQMRTHSDLLESPNHKWFSNIRGILTTSCWGWQFVNVL